MTILPVNPEELALLDILNGIPSHIVTRGDSYKGYIFEFMRSAGFLSEDPICVDENLGFRICKHA